MVVGGDDSSSSAAAASSSSSSSSSSSVPDPPKRRREAGLDPLLYPHRNGLVLSYCKVGDGAAQLIGFPRDDAFKLKYTYHHRIIRTGVSQSVGSFGQIVAWAIDMMEVFGAKDSVRTIDGRE